MNSRGLIPKFRRASGMPFAVGDEINLPLVRANGSLTGIQCVAVVADLRQGLDGAVIRLCVTGIPQDACSVVALLRLGQDTLHAVQRKLCGGEAALSVDGVFPEDEAILVHCCYAV